MLDRTHRFRRAGAAAVVAVVRRAARGLRRQHRTEQQAERVAARRSDAKKILDLTRPFFWIAVVIGIGVTVATIYVALRFREKPGEERAPKQVHGNTVLEVSWTIIPALILAVDGGADRRDHLLDLAKRARRARTSCTSPSARGSGGGSSPTTTDNIITANELHIPVGAPVSLTLEGPPQCDRPGLLQQRRHPLVLDPRAQRQEGRRSRPQPVPEARSQPARHVPRAVRRVLRSVARQHAYARDRADARRLPGLGAAASSSPKPTTVLLAGVQRRRSGAARAATASMPTKSGPVAPNLTQLADRCSVRGRHLRDELREPLAVGLQRARAASPWATSSRTCRTSCTPSSTTE